MQYTVPEFLFYEGIKDGKSNNETNYKIKLTDKLNDVYYLGYELGLSFNKDFDFLEEENEGI